MFSIKKDNAKKTVATEDITVYKNLETRVLKNLKVGEQATKIELIEINGEIENAYYSHRIPERGDYRFIIPKGSKYYYTPNNGMQYVSETIQLVSEDALAMEECIEICNFPKTYGEACERLGINPLNESKLIEFGLSAADIALKKLQTVIKCINTQYGVEKYDFNNPRQLKWFGWFHLGSSDVPMFYFKGEHFRTNGTCMDAGCAASLHLPFEIAANYVCSRNKEFFELWKTYLTAQ
jgi:hypothetical protein